jgi:hypothetical protein
MANRVQANPIYIDQFNADVELAANGIDFIVKKIVVLSAAAGDIFRLENEQGDYLVHITNNGGNARHTEMDFGDKGFNFGNKGVKIDVSDCTGMAGTDGTDAVWIYLK